jgi:peroxiredoxin
VKKLVLLALAFALILTALSAAQALKGKAPDFTLPDLNGKNVKLSDGPCKKEIPELINVYNKYKEKGFEVLAISTDKTGQGTVKSFVEAHKIPYRILLDSSGEVFTRKYKGNGIPYGFLLDKDGTIVQSFYGYMPGFEENLSKKVEELLGSSSEKTAPPKEAETKK